MVIRLNCCPKRVLSSMTQILHLSIDAYDKLGSSLLKMCMCGGSADAILPAKTFDNLL